MKLTARQTKVHVLP